MTQLSNPQITIILPVYNAENTIQQTIESVLKQTVKDYELLVIDDGSTDNTKERLEHFGDKIIYIRKENGGVSSARNKGLSLAKGEFIAFIDSDDIWYADKLEKQLKIFQRDKEKKIGLVFTDRASFDPEGKSLHKEFEFVSSGDIFQKLLITNFITTVTVMIRHSCLKEVGVFDEKKKVSEDWDLWLRIARHYQCVYINEKLAGKGYIPGSLSWDKLNMYEKNIEIQKYYLANPKELDLREEDEFFLKRGLAHNYKNIGGHHFKNNDYLASRRFLKESLNFNYNAKTFRAWLLTFFPLQLVLALKSFKRLLRQRNG